MRLMIFDVQIFSCLLLLLSSITKERTEVIYQGTASSDPKDPEAVWEEYQFLCKPGDVYRRPCLVSPYHYRLDWLMWFAAFQVRCCRWFLTQTIEIYIGFVVNRLF